MELQNLTAIGVTTPELLEEYVCEGTVNGTKGEDYGICGSLPHLPS